MRILIAHNYYQQSGGEDIVFAAETALLQEHGHDIIEFTDNNNRIQDINPLVVAIQSLWSHPSYKKISAIINNEKPDVVHFHNTFPLISPSAYYACHDAGIPVIQTLHNYRILCPASIFLRNNKICEDCLGKYFAISGVFHACYHTSRLQTTVVSTMISLHKSLGTWNNLVDSYIVTTNFSRLKFIEGGLPESKILVKPHFITADLDTDHKRGGFAFFVGRLSNEKGILTLLQAWKALSSPIPLKIAGDGPLRGEVMKFIESNHLKHVEYLGKAQYDQILSLIKNALFLVVPSECYETFGLVVIEAYSRGVPVIASNIGVMAEMVSDNKTGLLFIPRNFLDLAAKVESLWNHPDMVESMGLQAHLEYERKYTPERNYQMLLDIYNQAMATKR